MLVGKERLKGVGICLALAVAVGAVPSIGRDSEAAEVAASFSSLSTLGLLPVQFSGTFEGILDPHPCFIGMESPGLGLAAADPRATAATGVAGMILMVMTGLSNLAAYLHAEMQFRDFTLVTSDKALIHTNAGVQKPCCKMMIWISKEGLSRSWY